MLVVTADEIPGWEIERVCGDVFGLALRHTSLTGVGAVVIDSQTTFANLSAIRKQARAAMIKEAMALGGNAIVALRFDTNELGQLFSEVCAYGTAVYAMPATEAAKYTAQQLGYPQLP